MTSRTDSHGHTKLEVRTPAQLDHQGVQVWRVEWNVTGTILATAGDDGCVRLWKCRFEVGPRCMYRVCSQLPGLVEVHLGAERRWVLRSAFLSPPFPPSHSSARLCWNSGRHLFCSSQRESNMVSHNFVVQLKLQSGGWLTCLFCFSLLALRLNWKELGDL